MSMASINSNEFTMLEFYRVGFDMHQLIDEIKELLIALGNDDPVKRYRMLKLSLIMQKLIY